MKKLCDVAQEICDHAEDCNICILNNPDKEVMNYSFDEIPLSVLVHDEQCGIREHQLYTWILSKGGNPVYTGGMNWSHIEKLSPDITEKDLDEKLAELRFDNRGLVVSDNNRWFAYR